MSKDELIVQMAAALKPFADCVEHIRNNESDEEWAKFRLLVKDYRRAAAAFYAYVTTVGDAQ